jgi:hypothetical protein
MCGSVSLRNRLWRVARFPKLAVSNWVEISGKKEGVYMKRTVIVSVLMMLLFALAARAQTTPAGPEHKKLGAFVGTWADEGKTEATPWGGKAGSSKGTSKCTWYAGEYQMVCDAEDTGPNGKVKSHGILGYSVQRKQYFSTSINSAGGSSYYSPCNFDGSVWTYEGNLTREGKTYQRRFVGKFASPKEWNYKWEYSEDGKNWKLSSEGKMTKK